MEELKVHGSIFFLLRKFVISHYPAHTWEKIQSEAQQKGYVYDITNNYPISQIGSLLDSASNLLKVSVNDLKEKFGEFMVPDLFVMYHSYLNPEWRTFDVLENTERVMHGAVRSLNSTAHPPILNVTKVNSKLLIIDYFSKRRMGGLAIGIIKGIAKFYNEEGLINVKAMTDPDDERMQIRVEYTLS